MVVENKTNSEHNSPTENRRFDRSGAAHYCGVSVVTIDRALAKKQIAHYRIGRRIVFDARHLDEFLKANERRAK